MDETKDRPPAGANARSEASSPASAAPFSAKSSRSQPRVTVPPCSATWSRSRPRPTAASAAPFSASRPRPTAPSATPFSASRSRLRPTAPIAATFSASRSRPRPTAPSATPFSASRSCARPAIHNLRADVDYSQYTPKMLKKLRLVPEEEWFPHQRHDRHLTGGQFWTVVQKYLYHAFKKGASAMRWVDWPSVNQSTGTDVRGYFAATPGLDKLLERRDLRWAEPHIRQFYATLWIHPDRSRIKFMFGDQQRELSRDDFAKYLGLSHGGAQVHSLAYPNGKRGEVLPPLESIRHLYNNPDAVVEHWKDHSQWNHETAVVHSIVRISIRPRSGGLDSLTPLEIWILHLLMSEKPIDIVDLMIGEMQETILNIKQRLLPYAPYLIYLFDKKGWLERGMINVLGKHLDPYRPPKRRLKNRALQPVKPSKASKPDGRRRVGARSLPPQGEAGFDNENAQLDHTLSPSLEEHALGKTTNGEDDLQMVPFLVSNEFRFSQQGAHDIEAGSSGGHAYDDPPMLQRHVDPQPGNLEQIQGQLVEIQGQLADLKTLFVVSLAHTLRNSSHQSDILALLDKRFSASCRL